MLFVAFVGVMELQLAAKGFRTSVTDCRCYGYVSDCVQVILENAH